MATILGVNFDYTYNGILSDVVSLKPSTQTPALTSIFSTVPSIKYQAKIPTLAPLDKIVKEYVSCTREFTSSNNIGNTSISVAKHQVNTEWCQDDFEEDITGNILAEKWLKTGVNRFDPSGTEIARLINMQMMDAIRRDTFRIISFADTTSGDPDYKTIDGLWTKLIAGTSSYDVKRTSTALGTGALASGAALGSFKECYEESEIILKQIATPEKQFLVTGSVYENLLSSYESNTTGSEKQFLNLVGGQGTGETALRYRGIDVIPVYAWDEALLDPANPLFGTMKHGIIYTTKSSSSARNHYMAVENTADLNKVSGWYERKDRQYYFESFYAFGYNYRHGGLQTIAY